MHPIWGFIPFYGILWHMGKPKPMVYQSLSPFLPVLSLGISISPNFFLSESLVSPWSPHVATRVSGWIEPGWSWLIPLDPTGSEVWCDYLALFHQGPVSLQSLSGQAESWGLDPAIWSAASRLVTTSHDGFCASGVKRGRIVWWTWIMASMQTVQGFELGDFSMIFDDFPHKFWAVWGQFGPFQRDSSTSP